MMTATTPSWGVQQLPLQQWQRCLHIDSNDINTQGPRCQLDYKQWGQQCMPAHTCKWAYHMFVFAHTLTNISYVWACEPAGEPCEPLLWASAPQISSLPRLPPLFWNICEQKLGSIVHAETRKRQQQLCWCYKNKSLVLMFTLFFCWIGFLSQTALSQPSQQGKESLDKGICTDSRVTHSNYVRHWMHQGEGGLTLRRGKSRIGNFGLAANLSLLFLGSFCILCCVPQKLFFSGRKWVSRSKKNSFTPYQPKSKARCMIRPGYWVRFWGGGGRLATSSSQCRTAGPNAGLGIPM